MTPDEQRHDALIECGSHCEGILRKSIGSVKQVRCSEVNNEYAVTYKGRVLLQMYKVSSTEVEMLCFKCYTKRDIEKRKSIPREKKTDLNQIDMFKN